MFSGHNQSFTCGDFTPGVFPLLASCECVKFSPSSATIPMAATDGIFKTFIIWDLQPGPGLRNFGPEAKKNFWPIIFKNQKKWLKMQCRDLNSAPLIRILVL
ncbi:hypothetical protein IGI04_006215 [Brassica rapa subsp. trilocularis]|uniref:Uncharacterized protein n=1 Tax=Brassica rapa subsp. trilocularis TaxID=1813537 RepID=A0ABQ7NIB2_BRACM|nr:hypothetical protein IGI04_006215 [Brassica rapa subsp. trilocularis]